MQRGPPLDGEMLQSSVELASLLGDFAGDFVDSNELPQVRHVGR